jgi:hypothetical protein
VVGDTPAQVAFVSRFLGGELGGEGPAGKLVESGAATHRFGEREAAQPGAQGAAIDLRQHVAEQAGIDAVGDRGDRQHVGVGAVDLIADDAPDQRRGDRPPTLLAVAVRIRRPTLAVGGHRQRQRRSPGPVDQLALDPGVLDPASFEQQAGVAAVERAEGQDQRRGLPAVLLPAGLGRAAAGDEHPRRLRQARQDPPAQQLAEGLDPLVGVEQDQRPGTRAGPRQRALQLPRRRRQLTAVDGEDLVTERARPAPELTQERALADPAVAVDEPDVDAARGLDDAFEHFQLPIASGEAGGVVARDALSQAGHRGRS